jgi:hypothetical protein
MKPRVWKKKAYRYMKKVMIPKLRPVIGSRREENIYAHEFARAWVKGNCEKEVQG